MADAGCHTTTEDEDLQQLAALEANPPRAVLICSDLHLGPGYDPTTGQVDRTENFVQDAPFSRFVSHHIDALADGGDDRPALLILNGDIVDFTRITNVPRLEDDFKHWKAILADIGFDKSIEKLKESIKRKERWYGLRSHNYKVVWKFDHVVRGHPVFFEALARWVSAGHQLLYVKGNHDVEIEHPLLRRAFRAALVRAGATPEDAHARVAFSMDGLRLANAWIEHGHQFEDMTKVEGNPFLDKKRKEEIRQPLGNFVNRYLLNPIEHVQPFLNNIKPVQGVVFKLLRHHPVRSLSILFGASFFVSKTLAMARVGTFLAFLLFLLFFLGGWFVAIGLVVVLVDFITSGLSEFSMSLARWTAIAFVGAVGISLGVSAIKELIARMNRKLMSPYVEDCSKKGLAQLAKYTNYTQKYVIVGHTHEQDSRRLPDNAAPGPSMYLNTGTWIPLWSDDRPDLHGKSLRPFVRLDLTTLDKGVEYRHAHQQWNDERGVTEPSIIFSHAPQ